jgi:5-methyltetrahydrofolate--homocysteine methyltransferase
LRPILLDGGLGTTLMTRGLPPATSAGAWALAHEADLAAVHRAFRDAGAEVACTATLRCVSGGDDDPEGVVAVAVRAARSTGAAVFGSLGPVGPGRPRDWEEAARRLAAHDVRDVVLETFVDPDELVAAARSARRAPVRVLIASVVPSADGRAWDGRALDVALAPVVDLVDGVGVNCATPAACAAALDALDRLGLPLWCKPSRAAGDVDWARDVARLAPRVRWLGGCCGADPASIAALREALA